MQSADWIHWRGPEQNGHSREKRAARQLRPGAKAKGNVVWTAPFGGAVVAAGHGRPHVHHQGLRRRADRGRTGRLPRREDRQEAVGEPSQRLPHGHRVQPPRLDHARPPTRPPGTSTPTPPPATLLCLDKTGKIVWQRQLTEEFGRVTGYGGRIVGPIFDSGLVIVGMVNSSWGDQARGGNRFVAFDGKTGEVVWSADTGLPIKGTYYSNPVVAVISGQRLLITGGGDGACTPSRSAPARRCGATRSAPGPSTLARSWTATSSTPPTARRTPRAGPSAASSAWTPSQVDPKTKKPKLVWEYQQGAAVRAGVAGHGRRPAVRAGRQRRTVLLRRQDRQTALEVPLRHRGPRGPARRRRQALHLRREGQAVDHHARRRRRPSRTDVFDYQLPRASTAPVQTETNGTPDRGQRPGVLHHPHRPVLPRRSRTRSRAR